LLSHFPKSFASYTKFAFREFFIMKKEMRAISFSDFGGPEVLRLTDLPMPVPAAKELLVQVGYASVNPSDWKIRQGEMRDLLPHRFPIVPGWDFSGIVTACGPGASLYKAGDKVYGCAIQGTIQNGTYAEFIAIPEKQVARMPDTIGFKDAASIPVAGLTAWQALFDHATIGLGEKILIHAGAGGVGCFAIQMAAASGLNVFATASLRNHDLIKELGTLTAIDYAREKFEDICQEEGGVDVVLDVLGGETLQRSFQAIKPGGRLISTVSEPDPTKAKNMNVNASTFVVQPRADQLTKIAKWIEDGKLKIPPLREYDLKDAAAAQSLSATGHIQGKIVLKVK